MPNDPFDTLVEYEGAIALPKVDLARRREQFLLVRRFMRAILGWLLVVTISLVTYIFMHNTSAAKWLALPIPVVLAMLLFAIERVQFCSECDALLLPSLWTKPAYCANCGHLLLPAKMLLHAPGTIDLSDQRYQSFDEPARKLIAMVLEIGIKDRATEIRFEPGPDLYRLTYRCGGELYEMVPPPLHLHRAISDSVKAMTGLSQERTAQLGNLRIAFEGMSILARVETAPGEIGEKVELFLSESNGKS